MPQKKIEPHIGFQSRLLLIALLVCALLLFTIWSTPFAVSNGVRLWLWWKSRQQGLELKIDKVDAPLLRPVVLRGFHIMSSHDAAFRIDASLARATVGLNLNSILLRRSGAALRALSADSMRINIRRGNASQEMLNETGWRSLQKLIPDSFSFEHVDLRVEDRQTVVLLRNISLSGTEIEAGHFRVDQVVIGSPWFRQTFAQLRGATKWEERRLTIAGLSLAPNVDLPSATVDLSQLGNRAIGIDFNAEIFRGKVRAEISHDWRSEAANWNLVGSASDVSLTKTPPVVGFTGRLSGLIHACKFSFRGNILDPAAATGWIWAELTALSWRDRAADVVMLGAALSNRQIAIEQLYLKQNQNELTLAGETVIPASFYNWMNLEFRLDLSASIADLSDFAGLFGANPGQFAGEISVTGTLNGHDQKFSGNLSAAGSALRISDAPIDQLRAKINFTGTQMQMEELTLNRGEDFLRGQGKIDVLHDHAVQGTVRFSVRDVRDYFHSLSHSGGVGAAVTFDGKAAAIDSLEVQNGPRRVGFRGTSDFNDLRNIGVTFVPLQPLLDPGSLRGGDCVGDVQFLTATDRDKALPEIKRVDLRGSALTGSWTITLEKEGKPDETLPLCRDPRSQTLELLTAVETSSEFGAKALQSFHRGSNTPLKFSPDQP
jgi:hypothetical protein